MTGLLARTSSLALLVGLVAVIAPETPALAHESPEHNCAITGQWIDPASGDVTDHREVIEAAAAQSIVMLGEIHPNVEHHRWQLSAISALYGRNPNMVPWLRIVSARPCSLFWIVGSQAN